MPALTRHESRGRARVQHEDSRPTGRQIWRLTADLLAIAGEPFPETRAAASELIERLSEQRAAIEAATATSTGDSDAPF